ncbi:hypothetical protein TrCOL_g9351 [Triparma columacea]|uniref:Glycosyltransferase family 2 protein n=1 Tax=Triparma columacea TaxID=722753 RepID=A0A9W7GI85_9STRA|nr:hypothetical protein TrCOL_g9351 [Triparma columacea]
MMLLMISLSIIIITINLPEPHIKVASITHTHTPSTTNLRRTRTRPHALPSVPPPYKITISVITAASTASRLNSLRRLLDSLIASDYPPETSLTLRISIDSTASHDTLDYINAFEWSYGPKVINRRVKKGGLVAAVAESWYPSDDFEHGVILEDDIEVSPYWYDYVTTVLDGVYENGDDEVVGVSLYNPRTIEVIAGRGKFVDFDSTKVTGQRLYKHQVPCSWGAVWMPGPWREFLTYLEGRIREDPEGLHPMTITGSNTMTWKLSWKKFMLEIMYVKDWYVVYPSFKDQVSFATNHVEIGEHIKDKRSQKRFAPGFTVPLFDQTTFTALNPLTGMKENYPQTPNLDIFGRPILPPTLALAQGSTPPPSTSWNPSKKIDPPCTTTIRDKTYPFYFPPSLKSPFPSLTLHLTSSPNLLYQLHHYLPTRSITQVVVTHINDTSPPPPNLQLLKTPITFVHRPTGITGDVGLMPTTKGSSTTGLLIVGPGTAIDREGIQALASAGERWGDKIITYQGAGCGDVALVPTGMIEEYRCKGEPKDEGVIEGLRRALGAGIKVIVGQWEIEVYGKGGGGGGGEGCVLEGEGVEYVKGRRGKDGKMMFIDASMDAGGNGGGNVIRLEEEFPFIVEPLEYVDVLG